jgi:5'-nucleotidase
MAHIGVDCDGVVYEFHEDAKIVVANHRGIDPSELTTAKVWDFMIEQWGMESKEFWDLWFKDVAKEGAWMRLPPVEGTVEGLKRLQKAGHTIHIITSRKGGEVNTVKWIQKHKIPYDTLHIGRDKTRVLVDVMVDDWEGNWHELTAAGRRVLVWDQPWNEHLLEAERVHSWDDVLKAVS